MNGLSVHKLRCEYKENPLGIDVREPRLSWQLQSNCKGAMQVAYRIQVAEDNAFTVLVWDTGKMETDQCVHIIYGGEPLRSQTRYYYRVRVWDNRGRETDWSASAWWETAMLDKSVWKALWITYDGEQTEGCPFLRTTFICRGRVAEARIYATSLGLYELRLNGSKVGEALLTPGWTSYNKRLQYQTYDVTGNIYEERNALGAILGNGWYKGKFGWNHEGDVYGGHLAALVQLHVRYEDGSEDVFFSDRSWKVSSGPILMSDIYHGETYDARREKQGWDTAEYDDDLWVPASVLDHTKDILVAQESLPVKVTEEIKPIRLFTTLPERRCWIWDRTWWDGSASAWKRRREAALSCSMPRFWTTKATCILKT